MKNQELLKTANQILKSNNYRFEFEKIQEMPENSLDESGDIFTMGSLNGCELLYTMAVLPTNFLSTADKLYILF